MNIINYNPLLHKVSHFSSKDIFIGNMSYLDYIISNWTHGNKVKLRSKQSFHNRSNMVHGNVLKMIMSVITCLQPS